MKNNKNILKGILMISQLGISILVPIFLCLFIGIKLDQWLSKDYFTLILLALGFIVSFRNVYFLTKGFYAKDKAKEDAFLNHDYDSYLIQKSEEEREKEKTKKDADEEFNKWKDNHSGK